MFVDTTLLIDFLRGQPKAVQIIQKREFSFLFTSEINVFELIEGVYLADEEVQSHLEKVLAMLSRMTVLSFDRKAALKAGEISATLTKKGKKIGETDILIASIALANGISKIITENKDHFERIKELEVITY
ncbi:MAG: type II toxin-antitoxin system VapC family toxin [Nanoarchaeota archaeon]|nr:type II toxin-antitoxin system VapC family toxin [Nanoarchaeota archaeon]MBU1623259.1 type II toxin-antitoxin system VapC family toxin [Nanoarchaeota archaeon]MBU1974307.1 type II toxin-antitoxin system VapC family toxin [Nanoarchaeota archaeon]